MRRRWFLNDDIPTIILSRLSAKTLNLVKNVSKRWLCLITSRPFIRLQLETNKEPLDGFFFQEIFEYADCDDLSGTSYIPVEVNTESWRRSNERCQYNHSLIKNKGISAGGCLYWITDRHKILMLDSQNELSLLVETPMATSHLNSIPEMCIGESENKLNYVIIFEDGLQVWVLEDHITSDWHLKYFISLERLEKAHSEFLYEIKKKAAARLCKDAPAWLDP